MRQLDFFTPIAPTHTPNHARGATLAAMTEDNNTLRERNAHLQALHAERVRQLLAKSYTIIDSTIQWRRTGNR